MQFVIYTVLCFVPFKHTELCTFVSCITFMVTNEMIYLKTIFMCFVILVLCFCNNESMAVTTKDNGVDVPVNTEWSDISISNRYHSKKQIVEENGWKEVSPIKERLKTNPLYPIFKKIIAKPVTSSNYQRNVAQPGLISTKAWQTRSRLTTDSKPKYKRLPSNDYQWTTEDYYQCRGSQDCQSILRNSHCIELDNGRRMCNCTNDYVEYRSECLFMKVHIRERCKISKQCIDRLSICHYGYCECPYGLHRGNQECVYANPQRSPNDSFIWPLTIAMVPVVISLLVLIVWLMKGMYFSRRNTATTQAPGSSEVRRRTISETCIERLDKPPTYDEVISTSTSTLNLSNEELSQVPPPSYDVVQGTTCHAR